MPTEHVPDLDDPRLAAYGDLKDRELAAQGGRFIAEGRLVVERLLASTLRIESILVAQRRLELMVPLVPAHVPVYVVPDALVPRIIGFQFHSGVMACAFRPARPDVEMYMQSVAHQGGPMTLVVCPQLVDHENIGSIIRIAAAFGADGLLFGERCSDPWWRRSVRVSMGTIFHRPILHSDDLRRDLAVMQRAHGVQLIATVTDEDAQPLAEAHRPTSPDRIAILFGAEYDGLADDMVALCDRRVTIPMHGQTDSLNVAAAAAVVLYHFTQAGASR